MTEQIQKLPIKQHVERIRTLLDYVRKQLGSNSKLIEQIKEDLSVSQFKIQDPFKDLLQYCLKETDKMEHVFNKDSLTLEQQLQFLRGQIEQVEEDKIKINQQLLVIDSRLQQIGKDIGFQ